MTLHAQLTQEIRQGPSGPKVGAFFDLDQTLLAGFSATAFFRERVVSGSVSPRELFHSAVGALSFGLGRTGFSGFMAASTAAYRGLAEIELKAGRLDEAEVAFRRALEIRPDDRELYEFLGTLYFRAGRLDEAEALFRDSIRVAPDSAQGYRNLAGIHIARGELEEASKVLARALKIQPTATLYLNQGTVFFFQGLYPQAAAAYESALGFPYGANLHSAWANLGDAWRQIPHRWHQAPEAFREAIRLLAPEVERKSDKSWLRSQLALYRAKAGQKEEALRDVDAVRPGDARTSFRLAVACEVLGERERALAFLAQALAEGFRPSEVEREPELLALRSDPRYHRLRASAGP